MCVGGGGGKFLWSVHLSVCLCPLNSSQMAVQIKHKFSGHTGGKLAMHISKICMIGLKLKFAIAIFKPIQKRVFKRLR